MYSRVCLFLEVPPSSLLMMYIWDQIGYSNVPVYSNGSETYFS